MPCGQVDRRECKHRNVKVVDMEAISQDTARPRGQSTILPSALHTVLARQPQRRLSSIEDQASMTKLPSLFAFSNGLACAECLGDGPRSSFIVHADRNCLLEIEYKPSRYVLQMLPLRDSQSNRQLRPDVQ